MKTTVKFMLMSSMWVTLFVTCTTTKESFHRPYLNNYNRQRTVIAVNGGVACAHPLASKVGLYILQQGGNAVDAAIAMQLALAVVYPEAGNIGGGGFMVMHLADGTTKALDFREMAPASAHKNMYLDSNGNPNLLKSLVGHLASGVPGTIAGIFESLPYAKLPFRKLIQPAIDLAEKGYVYTPGIASDIGDANPKFNTTPNVFDGSHKWKEGDTVRQPDLANTLKRIRDHGKKDFYEGKTATLIVAEMQRGRGNITMDDLKNYKAKWREPQIFNYRDYTIISMSLPSSGGILLNQMLKMIEPYPISTYGYGSVKAISLMIEAERRAYRDRSAYLGDGDFSPVPVKTLVSDEYLKMQMSDFIFGVAGVSKPLSTKPLLPESKETTHLSVVDKDGNAVSVTTTLNGPFGSSVVVGNAGFFLNNEMNDFSLKPGTISYSGGVGGIANSIEPGKRMLSSMSPTIVLKGNKFFMVLGTPGGTTIPTSVFQVLVNVIDFNMSGTDAVVKPKFHHEWIPDEIMMGRFSSDTIALLKKIGYKIVKGGGSSIELIKKTYHGRLEIVSEDGSAEGY